jgi:hypothetical protein
MKGTAIEQSWILIKSPESPCAASAPHVVLLRS